MEILDEKDICKTVASKLEMPFELVLGIYRSSISYTIHTMEHSGFDTIMLPYFGKFMVKPYRLKKFNENKIKRKHGII